MKLLIAGASGFIGSQLVERLGKQHEIMVLGRNQAALAKQFPAPIQSIDWEMLELQDANSFDAIINLCGKNIAESRWTEQIKQEIIFSRVNSNHRLINWILAQNARPAFYCANAVGIYGIQKLDDPSYFTENSFIDDENPPDFMSEIGIRWEHALNPAIDAGIPVTITRFGVVLDKRAGMLKRLLPFFKFGGGSIMGCGKQIISWIDSEDVLRAYEFLLQNPEITGPFNVTSPQPVSQEEFARTLAKVLKRPLLLRTPAFVVRWLFGEMGECLLLSGQKVLPSRLSQNGFQFNYPSLEKSLEHQLNPSEPQEGDKIE